MSTSGITSSLLASIADSPTAANQFVTDLNQLAQDLQSGNLSAAQQDFVTLSQDALNGTTSSTTTTSSSGITTALLSAVSSSTTGTSAFANDLNQLGADLENGDLGLAQNDMLALDSTAQNAAPSNTTSTSASTSAETKELIQAIVEGMQAGDDSAVSSAMSELASVSTSSQGASYLTAASQNYGSSISSTSASSSSGSLSQLLQSLNSSSDSSSSSLSLLA